jgi:hypothetical protein
MDETADLIADDVDASLVGGIEMNHETLVLFIDFLLIRIDEIDNGRRFPSSRRTVKE